MVSIKGNLARTRGEACTGPEPVTSTQKNPVFNSAVRFMGNEIMCDIKAVPYGRLQHLSIK